MRVRAKYLARELQLRESLERNGELPAEKQVIYGEVMISAMIPCNIWAECRANGWKYKELIVLGVQAKKGMPIILNRINELEEGNRKLQGKVTKLWQELEARR